MEEEIIKKIDMLSLKMIEDIKTIVKMPSVEGTFQQGAPFGKDIPPDGKPLEWGSGFLFFFQRVLNQTLQIGQGF